MIYMQELTNLFFPCVTSFFDYAIKFTFNYSRFLKYLIRHYIVNNTLVTKIKSAKLKLNQGDSFVSYLKRPISAFIAFLISFVNLLPVRLSSMH